MANKLFRCDQILQVLKVTISKSGSTNHNNRGDVQRTITNMHPKMLQIC